MPIQGRGDVIVPIAAPVPAKAPTRTLRLRNAVFCPTFLCNVVSLQKLLRRGYWWDTRASPTRLCRGDGSTLAQVMNIYDQFVLEYIPVSNNGNINSTFTAHQQQRKRHQNTYTPVRDRRPRPVSSDTWHRRLGHPNSEALMHLVNHVTGVRMRGPTNVQCDQCGISKIKRKVDRSPRDTGKLGQRIALDFHDFELASDNSHYLALFTDRCTGMIWDYYLPDRKAPTVISSSPTLHQHGESTV